MSTTGLALVSGEATAQDVLRDWLLTQTQEKGVTVTAIAREAGVARTVLSLVIHGHRPMSAKIEEKLRAYMNIATGETGAESNNESNHEKTEALKTMKEPDKKEDSPGTDNEKPAFPQPNNFQKDITGFQLLTEDLRQVLGMCGMCMEDGEIGVVIGPAGAGKTTSLRDYCNREARAVYVCADITMSAKELLQEIGSALGITLDGSRRNMIRQLIRRLKADTSLIIIDEADLLVSKDSVKKLEILRSVWDGAQSGLVLAGPPRLATFLVKGPGGRENLAQFYSRVRRSYYMKGVGREDVMSFLDGISVDKDATNYLVRAAIAKTNGGLRRFKRLLQNALDLIEPGETITLAVVKEADSLLVSPRSLGLEF